MERDLFPVNCPHDWQPVDLATGYYDETGWHDYSPLALFRCRLCGETGYPIPEEAP